ncbi:Uu.00g118200.m01.CDS01 [Anthostomella pinea]|uniref:Uu.00g118200.m01.CDS01 n=1 Tax=Anthostomella pinea TaxID=933095 RepID=A0AAI8YH09_9PEZI|nr:Uu.00g118200.m01.CDS01 [Anthostomella pinea]
MCNNFNGDLAPFCQLTNGSKPNSGSTYKKEGQDGFAVPDLRAGDGKYSWQILDTYRANGQDTLALVDTASGNETLTPGPHVQLVRAKSSGPDVLAIVLPVLFRVLVLGLVGAYLFKRRRNPEFTLRGMLPGGRAGAGAGYGAKQSIRERMAAAGGATVQMGPVDYSRPRDGQNVSRDELRRQQTFK